MVAVVEALAKAYIWLVRVFHLYHIIHQFYFDIYSSLNFRILLLKGDFCRVHVFTWVANFTLASFTTISFSIIEEASPVVQTMLFSATYGEDVVKFAMQLIKNAVTVT